jgi:peptidoglycan/LPS O-acetylase OafA/YrhL
MSAPTGPQLFDSATRGPQSAFASTDLPNFDFMRSVAVLLVLFGHLTYFLGITNWKSLNITFAGSLGVKIFFVHTCFVLMLSLERVWKRQGAFVLFRTFMVRRIFRIYPLSITVISLVVLFHLPMAQLSSGQFLALPLNPARVISNLFLVQNSRDSIVGPTWSLPFELGMYLFLPWIFLLLYPTKSLWRSMVTWFFSILAASVVLTYSARGSNNFLLYVPCFLPGVVAYQLQRRPRRQVAAVLWPALVVAIIVMYLWNQNVVPSSSVKGWIVCLVLGLGSPFFRQLSASWLTEPSRLIAKYSYGIYLTHFFCIWLIFDRLHYILPRAIRLPLFAALIVLVPIALYRCIEGPLIEAGKRIATRFDKKKEACLA